MSDYLLPGEDLNISALQDRNFSFQKSFKQEICKISSEKFAIELRKSHRSQHTAKRRALFDPSRYSDIFAQNYSGKTTITVMPMVLIKTYPELADEKVSPIEKLVIIRKILENESITELILESLNCLVDVLACEAMPLELIFLLGFVPLFIKYLDLSYGSQIVYPAAVCLTNITAGEQYYTNCLVNIGGLAALVKIINSRSLQISALAIKAIGNIITGSLDFLQQAKNEQVFGKINNLLDESKEVHSELYMSIGFYVLQASHFRDDITFFDATQLTNWLERLMQLDEAFLIKDMIVAIYNLSCSNSSGCLKSKILLQFLASHMDQQLPITAISNIICQCEEQAAYFLKIGVMEKLIQNCESCINSVRKSAYKCICNIALSCDPHMVIDRDNFHQVLVRGLSDQDEGVKKECAYLFSNIAKILTYSYWQSLLGAGLLDALERNLDADSDSQIINEVLFVCTYMLLAGKLESDRTHDAKNRLADKFEESKCIECLEDLMSHDNPDIVEFAKEIIGEYFDGYLQAEQVYDSSEGIAKFNFS